MNEIHSHNLNQYLFIDNNNDKWIKIPNEYIKTINWVVFYLFKMADCNHINNANIYMSQGG